MLLLLRVLAIIPGTNNSETHQIFTATYRHSTNTSENCALYSQEKHSNVNFIIAIVKHRQHFAAILSFQIILQQGSYYRNFLENEHTMILFLECDHIHLLELYILTK